MFSLFQFSFALKWMAFFYTLSIMPVLEELLIGQAFIILRLLFPQKHESNLLVKWKSLVHEAGLLLFFQVVPTDRRERGQKSIIILILLAGIHPFGKERTHSRNGQHIMNVPSCLFGLHFFNMTPKEKKTGHLF